MFNIIMFNIYKQNKDSCYYIAKKLLFRFWNLYIKAKYHWLTDDDDNYISCFLCSFAHSSNDLKIKFAYNKYWTITWERGRRPSRSGMRGHRLSRIGMRGRRPSRRGMRGHGPSRSGMRGRRPSHIGVDTWINLSSDMHRQNVKKP